MARYLSFGAQFHNMGFWHHLGDRTCEMRLLVLFGDFVGWLKRDRAVGVVLGLGSIIHETMQTASFRGWVMRTGGIGVVRLCEMRCFASFGGSDMRNGHRFGPWLWETGMLASFGHTTTRNGGI